MHAEAGKAVPVERLPPGRLISTMLQQQQSGPVEDAIVDEDAVFDALIGESHEPGAAQEASRQHQAREPLERFLRSLLPARGEVS